MCTRARHTDVGQRRDGGIGVASGIVLVLGGAAAAWLQQRSAQAQQRLAADLAETRARTESIERLLRTVG